MPNNGVFKILDNKSYVILLKLGVIKCVSGYHALSNSQRRHPFDIGNMVMVENAL